MGILKRILKRKRTEAELAQQREREKEWANKCYNRGKRFGEKINLDDKIKRINEFGNNYPKSFFSILIGIIVGCFVLNILLAKCNGFLKNDDMIETVTVPKSETGKELIKEPVTNMYREMEKLQKLLEKKMNKDSLTRSDTIEIGKIIEKMENINKIIEETEDNEKN